MRKAIGIINHPDCIGGSSFYTGRKAKLEDFNPEEWRFAVWDDGVIYVRFVSPYLVNFHIAALKNASGKMVNDRVKHTLALLRDINVRRVQAKIHTANKPARYLAGRMGFKFKEMLETEFGEVAVYYKML